MAWQDYADQHVNTPALLIEIAFNSGTRYYSNEYVRTSTQLYKGKLLRLPRLSSSVGGIKRTYERNSITLEFDDTDYEFRGLEDSETVGLRNIVVTIKLAFQDDDYATPLTLFTGYIYDWKRLDELRYSISVEEESLNLDNEYPTKLVELSDYANADGSAIDLVIPIPYGAISAQGLSNDGAFGHPSLSNETGLPFVDTTTDSEVHLVGRQTAAITVDRVYKNGVLQTEGAGNDYQISTQTIDSMVHTEIRWEAGNNPTADDFISCDITFGTRKPVEAIYHFLDNFCGYSSSNFNTTSYNTARDKEDERDYNFAGALWKRKSLRAILDTWRNEFELDIYWNKSGEVCFNYLTADFATSPNHYKDYLHILENFDSDPKVGKIINFVRCGYHYHYSKTYFYYYKEYEDTDSQTKYGATYKDYPKLYWIQEYDTAYDMAMRKIVRLRNPIVFDKLKFPLRTFSDSLTDPLDITHFEGLGSSGYDEQEFQVREFNYDLDNFINEMLLEDVSEFFGIPCKLGDDTSLPADWTNASGSEKTYCYLCDSTTEEFSDGEPGKRLFD